MEIDKLIETIEYDGAVFEVVERPEVIWVGKTAYAPNFDVEPDIGGLFNTYQELVPTPKLDRINPDWNAAISIDYWKGGSAPRGMMFAQETYSENQADCYDIYKMPASMFIRILNDSKAAKLLGKDSCETWELFGVIKGTIMPQNSYKFNENGAQEIEYHNYKTNTWYAYIPVVKI